MELKRIRIRLYRNLLVELDLDTIAILEIRTKP
jgi:hypothetical protein